ncbi:unnamed protein product [Hermetia illucens]|uniref:Uncharacterized protein n=1 Tax=Hermetia illucens TaxID=343691 RepID=A0A7R8UXJ0_HERIL|nr:unnamed protein product [Hermetia illucens]
MYFDLQEDMEAKFGAIKNMIENDQAQARKSASENEGDTFAMDPRGNAENGGSVKGSHQTFAGECPQHILPDHFPASLASARIEI